MSLRKPFCALVILGGWILCFSSLKAQSESDSIQAQIDSLRAVLAQQSDSQKVNTYNSLLRCYEEQGRIENPENRWLGFPQEGLTATREALDLGLRQQDSSLLIRSHAYLTNYCRHHDDSLGAMQHLKAYKEITSAYGFRLGAKFDLSPSGEEFSFHNLIHYLRILEDEGQNWSLDDVLQPEQQQAFQVNPYMMEGLRPVLDKVYWVKVRLRGDRHRDDDYYFMVGYDDHSWREIDIYVPDSSGGFQHLRSGFHTPMAEKAIPEWRNYFSVFIPQDEVTTLYLRLARPSTIEVPKAIGIWRVNRDQVFRNEARENHINGIFQGVVLIQALFFVFLYFTTRQRFFLFYFVYLFGLSLFVLVANYFPKLFPLWPDYAVPIYAFASGLVGIGMVLFSYELLNVREMARWWKGFLRSSIVLMTLVVLAYILVTIYDYELLPWTDEYRLDFSIMRLGMLVFVLWLVASLYWAYRALQRGHSTAKYFLVANVFIVFGIGIPILSPLFDVIWVSFDEAMVSTRISIILQLGFFGLAIGHERSLLEKDKREALESNLALQKRINEATAKFVPYEFLRSLGRNSILDVNLGDQVEKEVTVFFADIRSYTTLSEKMTPRQNFAFLNAYLGRVGPIIKANRGFVNQYYGDGIMAIFMQETEDGVQAAIDMQAKLAVYNQKRQKQGRLPVSVGMGLHYGPLMMGVIGDEERMEAGVVSDTVNTAARMEGLTKTFGEQVIISGPTFESVEPPENTYFRYLGKVQVKGRTEPLGIYGMRILEIAPLAEEQENLFQEGLQAYHAGQIEEAVLLWQELLAHWPEDRAAQFYLRLAESQPVVDAQWNGVVVMDRKF
jgi:class 3 adenylate cyclase